MAFDGEALYDNSSFPKRVGLITGTVVAFNPNERQIAKLLGKDESEVKDPKYQSEDSDGNRKLRLDVWVEEKDGSRSKIKFYLTDKVQRSKTNKSKYIDIKGNLSYFVDSPEKLPDFMKQNSPWESRMGEYELYRFLQAYMSKINRRIAKEFGFDWDRLIKGKVDELTDLVGQPFTNDVCALLMVKAVKQDGEIAEYQEIYNKHFLPADAMKYFGDSRGEIKDARVSEFVREVTDREYGPKHFYGGVLGAARPYVREENPIIEILNRESPFMPEEDDDDDSLDYSIR